MMRVSCGILALLLGAGVSFGGLKWQSRDQAVEARLTDEQVEAFFSFKNEGEKPVKILSVRSNCGCTTAVPQKTEYGPGEDGQIKATFVIGTMQGQQNKQILVQTDDEGESTVLLAMKVTVPVVYEVKPGVLMWEAGESPSAKTVKIRVVSGQGIDLHAKTGGAGLEAKLEEQSEGREYELSVKPASTTQPSMGYVEVLPGEDSGVKRKVRVGALVLAGQALLPATQPSAAAK